MQGNVSLQSYRTLLLDCDGVMLDSNGLKTEAFYSIGYKYAGPEIAADLRAHHRANGGMSRFKKFEWLIANYPLKFAPTVAELAAEYGALVGELLKEAPETPGLKALLLKAKALGMRTYVISGGLESEVQGAMIHKGLMPYLDGVYGSPRNKMDILSAMAPQDWPRPALFIGDSRYDSEVAEAFDVTPIFMAHFSEWEEGKTYCTAHGIAVIEDLRALA